MLHAWNHFFTPHEHFPPALNANGASLLAEQASPFPLSLPPIFAVLKTLEHFPTLCAVLAEFPPALSSAFQRSLLFPDPDPAQQQRLDLLEQLVRRESALRRTDPLRLCGLLQHECVLYLIEGMLLEPACYRRELAFLLAVTPLPLQRTLAPLSPTLPLTVWPIHASWGLCVAAEERMLQAMEDQAVLLVNEVLLVKFFGKMSAVALKTTRLTNGTLLVAGCWYAPIDQRAAIRQAFDAGNSRLRGEGRWVLLRALEEDMEKDLLEQAQQYADTLPEQLPIPIGYSTRHEYRNWRNESM